MQAERRGAKQDRRGQKTVRRLAGRIFLRGGQQTRSVAAEPVGNFLET